MCCQLGCDVSHGAEVATGHQGGGRELRQRCRVGLVELVRDWGEVLASVVEIHLDRERTEVMRDTPGQREDGGNGRLRP